ncbi:type II toxin-antitoxin system RelE/ParE family toxin [candidate division KSB1 bacterium]|nr:type II toxin-antitoxin system RelE/ParE family toxin [candidate division KSB1 bacterium]
MSFNITIADSAFDDLAWLKKFERVTILEAIDTQLSHEPAKETRHRKQLRETTFSRWELRVGKYRAFYNVDEDRKTVDITAIGYKEHNTLFIRGKEVQI